MRANRAFKRIRWAAGAAAVSAAIAGIFIHPLPFLTQALLFLLLCCALCFFRLFLGPTAPDRAVAIDILGIVVVGFCGILAVFTGRDWYIDIAIAWALQSFIATLALAKFLEGKRFDE